MKTYVNIQGQKIEATVYGRTSDVDWDGRESKAIQVSMSYEQAKELFVNDTLWSIVAEYERKDLNPEYEGPLPDPEIYDNSDFCLSGPITDNRDGTVTIKMGKPTDRELLNILMEGKA